MYVIINKTPSETRQYPSHCHKHYEIMHYIKGTGEMRTELGALPFAPGTAVIVPPNVLHGSKGESDFVNISIECDFGGMLLCDAPIAIPGNEADEGARLVEMIWENRHGGEGYLHALCVAYAQCLLQKIKIENEMTVCIKHIIADISNHAFEQGFDVTKLLKQSGYAEDYVRAGFKKETGQTPIGFLTELRIKHACYLIDVYQNTLTLSQIAEQCGYSDYVYFSKKFKEITGLSPRQYRG